MGVLDRGVPDVIDTDALPLPLAIEIDYLAGRTRRWTTSDSGVGEGVRARALVVAGRSDEARAALDSIERNGPSDLQDLAAAAWAASRVGGARVADVLTAALGSADPDRFLTVGDVPVAHHALVVGLLAAARGDVEDAEVHLSAAADGGDRRAPLWGALARVEQSRVRWTLADLVPVEDPGRADAIETSRRLALAARTFFAAGGYRHLVSTTAALFGDAPEVDRAEPRLGHLIEDDHWSVGFGAQPPVSVRASKGLLAVRRLVTAGRPVPAVELEAFLDGADPIPFSPESLAGRLRDPRARSRTSKLLHRTVDRLTGVHPVLARHLGATIATGWVCDYRGDPSITWRC